jgi:FkbM family methyltransferase
LRRRGIDGTWIDVGAHHGEVTLGYAYHNPGLKIYAFEPNLRAATKLIGRSPNFVVIPMAVAENDGCADFHINAFDASSSLLSLNEVGVRSWIGGEVLKVESTVQVPTIRLDTFMGLVGIETVDFLKVDAQGMDLGVVRSAGSRLRDIEKIVVEVSLASVPVYTGEPSKEDVANYLRDAGFSLVEVQKQNNDQEENLTFVRSPGVTQV